MTNRGAAGGATSFPLEGRGTGALALALAAITAAALWLAPASAAPPAAAGPQVVSIGNFTFSPRTITIKAGTTVTWVNQDDAPHALVATDKSFRSRVMDTDERFSFTFTRPGAYDYFCSIHPQMTGKVVAAPS